MADEQQLDPGDPSASRQTMQEALASYLESRRLEELEQDRARRREEKEREVEQRKAKKMASAREAKARRLKGANEAQQRVSTHVGDAVRSLRAALQAAAEIKLPRHSPEGRLQAQTLRGLEDAIGNLRRVAQGPKYDTQNLDSDLDLYGEI
jgi:hypothetical protein